MRGLVYARDMHPNRCSVLHPETRLDPPAWRPLAVQSPGAREPDRAGGAERYAAWLRAALAARGLLDPTGTPLAIKARFGGPNLRCADGVSAAWVEACGRSRLRWWRHVARERAAIRAARRVIAIAPRVATDLARWYGRGDAAVVLNPLLQPLPPPATERDGLVFVGHAFRRKGLDRLIAALPVGVPLTVIGAGQGPRREGIRYLGPAPALPHIASAALLVHPARYEPYGNVVAEAVACGTPAVASDATGAACLLDPAHVWREATGIEGLRRVIIDALQAPRSPILQPPSAEAHLAALFAALA